LLVGRARDRRGSLAWLSGAIALAFLCSLTLWSQTASAELTRSYTGISFGPQGVGGGSFESVQGLAVDQTSGDVFVYDAPAGKIYKFGPAGEPLAFSSLGGSNVIEGAGPGPTLFEPGAEELALAPDGAPAGTAGDIYIANNVTVKVYSPAGVEIGTLGTGETCGVAVDPAGHVFIGSYPDTVREYVPSASPPTDADVSNTGHASIELCNVTADGLGDIYATNYLGHEIAKLEGLADPTPTTITPGGQAIAVDLGTNALFANRGNAVAEYGSDGGLALTFAENQISSSAAVAVGPGSNRIYVGDNSGKVKIFGAVVSLPEPNTGPVTHTPTEAVTLSGSVNPAGEQLTDCGFEYGLATEANFPTEASCVPAAQDIAVDSKLHAVSATISGLQPNSTYHYRLAVANDNGSAKGEALTFTTSGAPQISEIRSLNADQTSVTLEARINPSGFPTRYHFEWGPTSAYGNTIPAKRFEPVLGSGERPVPVTAELSDLSAASVYHYRVVASSGEGRETASPDQTVETVNSCGLPEGRCFELVSPRDAGPVDLPGVRSGPVELHYQSAPIAGELAYVSETGPPNATKGAEVLSKAVRGPDGWSSTQLSPPITAVTQSPDGTSASSKYYALNEELSCGIVASNQPLTDEASTRAVVEAGGINLYRQNSDGTYLAITRLPPENPEASAGVLGTFGVEAISQDCGKVIFRAPYHYPGIPVAQAEPLYEWDEGTLRSLSYIPGPSGEVLVPALTGITSEHFVFPYNTNVVSADGSRVFFSALRAESPNPGEIGHEGVFVRENGATTRDISLSETSRPDTGAKFQFATKDGSRVFFIANAGLTDHSSAEGEDLYEFNFKSNKLTDLSPGAEPGGAAVVGFIGASEDGSRGYFVGAGQLVPGRGKSLAENTTEHTLSVYVESGGQVGFVGAVMKDQLRTVVMGSPQTAQVTPDGRYLLFESSATVTEYEGGSGAREAYLYDSFASADATECVSCRQDGRASVASPESAVLPSTEGYSNSVYAPRALVERNGSPVVFFNSFNALAPGAEDGVNSIYEWSHRQVFRIASEPAGLMAPSFFPFMGASEEGIDLYFSTPQTLSWEDPDERYSIYDARIGGGFPEPAHASAPCEPSREGSCLGVATGAGPAIASPASQAFNGPGNHKHKKKQHKKKQHKKKQHKKKQHKKKQHKKKQHKKKQKARHVNDDRRADK
jgi:hypothetical protein